MRRLILHIGTEKTGTTSVQRWFSRNATLLAEQGVHYSGSLGQRSHIGLVQLATGALPPDLAAQGRRMLSPDPAADLLAEIAEARTAGARDLVISSEHAHSRITDPAHIARLADLLDGQFAQTQVVCFLRPQLELAVSALSTMARAGGQIDINRLDALMQPTNPYTDYPALLARWAAVFGAGAMLVVPCRRHPDSLRWFCDHLGLDAPPPESAPRSNAALDIGALALAGLLGPHGSGPDACPQLDRVPLHLLPMTAPLRLPRAKAQALQARFEAHNARLVHDWPALHPGDLTPDWDDYDPVGNAELLGAPQAAAPQLRALVRLLNAQVHVERAERRIAQAQKALARGRHAMARTEVNLALADAAIAAHCPRTRHRADRLTDVALALLPRISARD